MNLMFWKKKAAAEDSADESPGKSGDRAESRKSPDQESSHQKTSGDAQGESGSEESSPARPNRRMIIGAVAGALAFVAIGLAIWKIFLPSPEHSPKTPPKREAATAVTPAINQPTPLSEKPLIKLPPIEFTQKRKAKTQDQPADIEDLKKKYDALQTQVEALKTEPPHVEKPKSASSQADIDALEALEKQDAKLQTEIELLKAELPQLEKAQAEQQQANIDALAKQNSEMQAKIEALKKKQASATSAKQASQKAKQSAIGGDMSVGTQNPKATAMTLKEVIKAMNAASEEPPNTPAK